MKFCRRVFLSTRSSKDDSIFVELASSSSSSSSSLPPFQCFLAASRAERKRESSLFRIQFMSFAFHELASTEEDGFLFNG